MKIAVIGADGQLGTDICRQIPPADLLALTQNDIEVTDEVSVKRALEQAAPDVVINTAAFVRVDDAEEHPEACFQVNALGARNVAVACQNIGAKMVYISSDYVYGGDASRNKPYLEFDAPEPINTLGYSKIAGETFVRELCLRHFIVRVSGLFGQAGSQGKGSNFIETILRLGREHSEVRVVTDQVFSPTYTVDAAKTILKLVATQAYGTFHVTNSGICSWHEFTCEIFRQVGLATPIIPITTAEFPQRARRPAYSVLANYHLKLLGKEPLRHWKEALSAYLEERRK
ncbi:dTDP-4-dehydrorhamnose reductase [Chloroflexota bacterium]